MNRINYQLQMEKVIEEIKDKQNVPRLLIHSCCAPCSSYCLELLSQFFDITVLYYNPNIFPRSEYEYRIKEQQKLISLLPAKNKIKFMATEYTPKDFYDVVKGFEKEPEGGKRCTLCFKLRLEYTAIIAKKNNFDFFTTTLSISPLKDSERLNSIGGELADKYGVQYLFSDFKKKNGYKRSVELSKEYGLYRQNYCGCVYSSIDKSIVPQ